MASNSRLWQLPDWDNLPDSKTVVRLVVKARLPDWQETPDCPIGSHSDTYSRFPDWKKLSDWPIGRECPIARLAETARLDSHHHVQFTDALGRPSDWTIGRGNRKLPDWTIMSPCRRSLMQYPIGIFSDCPIDLDCPIPDWPFPDWLPIASKTLEGS